VARKAGVYAEVDHQLGGHKSICENAKQGEECKIEGPMRVGSKQNLACNWKREERITKQKTHFERNSGLACEGWTPVAPASNQLRNQKWERRGGGKPRRQGLSCRKPKNGK